MPASQRIESQALPLLRQKLAEQFEPGRREHHQHDSTKRNFVVRSFFKLKNWIENSVAFVFTLAFLIPLWFFKIGLSFLDLIERGIRFILWLYVKGIVLVINFIYKILAIFRITTAVNFFKQGVKKYLGNYSGPSIDQEQEYLSRLQLLMSKKQHDLIDVKKVEIKIKTPNIFFPYYEESRKVIPIENQQQYMQEANDDLVPERVVHQNIVETSHKLKNPQLLTLSESHFELKRTNTQPNLLATTRLAARIPFNREQSTPNHICEPNRDITPEKYKKSPPKIGSSCFKKKELPEKQILMIHHHPIIQGTEAERQQLQNQLIILKTKMQELITDNNKEIEELEEWIRQKSETIKMTRTENLQLLQQIEQIQKQNVLKTKKLAEFEEKVKEVEMMLEKEKTMKNGLNSQVQKLEEEIKTKTIEIMSLKYKIKKNFLHIQEMETIFGNQRMEISVQKEDQQIDFNMNFANDDSSTPRSLKNDLKEEEKGYPIKQTFLDNEKDISNIDLIDKNPDIKDIDVLEICSETESEKQKIKTMIPQDNIETKSNKSTPAEQHYGEETLQEKIIHEQENAIQLAEQVDAILRKEQEKLIEFKNENPKELQQIIKSVKHFKDPKLISQSFTSQPEQSKEEKLEQTKEKWDYHQKEVENKNLNHAKMKKNKRKR